MLGLGVSALALNLGPWISHVELNEFDVATGGNGGSALAALLQAQKQLVFNLKIPCVIIFACLQHSTSR